MTDEVLVRIKDVVKEFPVKAGSGFGHGKRLLQAVAGVSLEVRRGETLGLVGETGCGKSTLARCVVRLLEIDGGQVLFDDEDLTTAPHAAMPLKHSNNNCTTSKAQSTTSMQPVFMRWPNDSSRKPTDVANTSKTK